MTATEIKIGNTNPYSGPASAYGTIGKAIGAYFKKVNDEGGVNGRKINYITYDDGYSPPKAVEMVRKLVEQDQVAALFQTLGTPTNTAIHKYVNQQKVPHLFVATGATKWNDPKNFPWTMGWQPNYQTEGRVYAAYILKNFPDAKIGILYQNDDYGKDYRKGLHDGLGEAAKKMIVMEQTYEVTDPTIDSQIVNLKNSGANVFFNVTIPKFAVQAIKKAHDIGWKPGALPEQRVQLAGHRAQAGRARGLQGPDHRALHEGGHRPAVEERQGLPGLGRVDEEVLPGRRARRPVQRLRLHGRPGHDAGAQAVRQRLSAARTS